MRGQDIKIVEVHRTERRSFIKYRLAPWFRTLRRIKTAILIREFPRVAYYNQTAGRRERVGFLAS